MPMPTMVGNKRNHQKDSSPKKPAASPRRGQKNKQHKTNSGEKVVKNKPPPTSPAITQNSKAGRTQTNGAATAETPSTKIFQPPSNLEDDDIAKKKGNNDEDSDAETIDEEIKRLKTLVRHNDDEPDEDAPNHQGNWFLKQNADKTVNSKAPKTNTDKEIINIETSKVATTTTMTIAKPAQISKKQKIKRTTIATPAPIPPQKKSKRMKTKVKNPKIQTTAWTLRITTKKKQTKYRKRKKTGTSSNRKRH
jgi:hypothetical protein